VNYNDLDQYLDACKAYSESVVYDDDFYITDTQRELLEHLDEKFMITLLLAQSRKQNKDLQEIKDLLKNSRLYYGD
jgi:hypothetical protein